ncbi:hypothetical protein FA15DRAFT_691857 [Coprinopsis marcescibilis]|uniref:Crinkler effector protein N-terminal domain-containing protein n=1 Tax=Coprinopsis marcescibilis TaxID=230819 RepID=A0A5C3LIK3_COPMA|nr:hypothetical protein FA15DRAFT_691857 [Coprinopsis marcescibilis]
MRISLRLRSLSLLLLILLLVYPPSPSLAARLVPLLLGAEIQIPSNDDVSTLKKLIKQKKSNRLAHIDAPDIQLFSDSIPENDNLEATVKAIKFNERKELPSGKKISEVFQAPEKGHIHVIAVIPLASTPVIALNCVVSGDRAEQMFTVKIAPTDNVNILKASIREQNLDRFANIAVSAIQLFKVSLHLDNDLDRRLAALKIDEQEKLSPFQKISAVFEDIPDSTLHVVVLAPAAGLKRAIFPSLSQYDLSKRTKLATEDNIMTSWTRYHEMYHDDWETLHDLWETLWFAPKDPIPYFQCVSVERDQTCPEVQTPNQAWILKLPQAVARVLDILPKGILLRDEIFAAVEGVMAGCEPSARLSFKSNDPSKGFLDSIQSPSQVPQKNGVVVIGQPGIGKSTFLRVLFVLLLHAQWPVMFQYHPDFVVLVCKDGVKVSGIRDIKTFADIHGSNERRVVALVDSTEKLLCPSSEYYVNNPPIFIVQTPSPSQSRLAWRSKITDIERFVLKPWTLQDLLTARFLQHHDPSSERAIADLFYRFQPSARDSYAKDVQTYAGMVQAAVGGLTFDRLQSIVNEANKLDYGDLSHLVITMRPATLTTRDDDDNNANMDTAPVTNMDMDMEVDRTRCEFTIGGRETYEMLVDAFSLSEAKQADRFYKIFSRHPSSKTVAGWLLNDRVHTIFPAGGCWPLWDLQKSSTQGPKMQHHYKMDQDTPPKSYLHISKSGFDITKNPKADEGYPTLPLLTSDSLPEVLRSGYYQPPKGQASFDAFIYDESSSTILVLQVSAGQTQGVNAKGIEMLHKRGDVKRIVYVVVTPPKTYVDVSVAHTVDEMMEPEKYQIVLESIVPTYAPKAYFQVYPDRGLLTLGSHCHAWCTRRLSKPLACNFVLFESGCALKARGYKMGVELIRRFHRSWIWLIRLDSIFLYLRPQFSLFTARCPEAQQTCHIRMHRVRHGLSVCDLKDGRSATETWTRHMTLNFDVIRYALNRNRFRVEEEMISWNQVVSTKSSESYKKQLATLIARPLESWRK